MNKRKRRMAIPIVICICLSIGSIGNAANSYYRLSVSRKQQQKTMWCWAACAEMAGTYGNSSTRTQRDVVGHIYGSSYPNTGGSASQIVTGAEYASKNKIDAYTMGFPTLTAIKNQINGKFPVIMCLQWNSGGGHAVVISGYEDSKLYTIDPWQNVANKYYAYTAYMNGGTFALGTGRGREVVFKN